MSQLEGQADRDLLVMELKVLSIHRKEQLLRTFTHFNALPVCHRAASG